MEAFPTARCRQVAMTYTQPHLGELRLVGGRESNVSRTTAQPDACGYGEGARAAATPLEMQMQKRQEEEGTRGGDGGLHQGESTVSGR